MPEFIPGLELNRIFFHEAVKPVLAHNFPELRYSVARLGTGSEVLGYDDVTSTDHDWGPRLQLFLTPTDFVRQRDAVHETLSRHLPTHICGYPVHFGAPDREGTRLMATKESGPVDHRVEIWTIGDFFDDFLALDPRQPLTIANWLTMPQQLLLGVTAGAVYADGLGELESIRRRLAYYPRDVWLYLLAAQWARIGQEEPFMGRAGAVGDELGSQLIAARLVHDIMQLCFLMARTYAPYPKWFGVAFSRLACAPTLRPILEQVLEASDWQEREGHLCRAYTFVAEMHNELGVTPPLETAVSFFHERPFRVIGGERFVTALRDAIEDETVQAITTDVGGIDQFSHSTDLRSYPALHRRLEKLYVEED